MVQPGSERFTFGIGGPVKHALRLVSKNKLKHHESGLK
jgi:hypothetical protein